MHRRISWIAAVAVAMVVLLAGCGGKNADSIVKDLDKVVSKMESYEGSGTMTLHTGQQPLEYKVEVWYQKPDLYRIALTNAKRDITQIVLRNDEGVFVLTPQLKKSYRFQSDWPENQGQVYLYQTLAQSILLDNSRQFATDKDSYVFDVMAGNYQNGSFARQKIWLSQNDYAPKHVEVLDANGVKMVEVQFDSFEFDKKFDKSAFDMDKNMGVIPNANSKPTVAEGVAGPDGSADPQATASPDGQPTTGEAIEEPVPAATTFSPVEPDIDALPAGVELLDSSELQFGGEPGLMLRYTGSYDFTIVQRAAKDAEATFGEGETWDLGFTLGHLTGDAVKTLSWSDNGMNYSITSENLLPDQMKLIAQAMVDSSGK